MNFKNLQNDFKTIYNTNITVPCTFSGTSLFLLGDVTCDCGGSSLITSLSSGTSLALNTHKKDSIYSIQQTRENLVFTCKADKLSLYHENNYAKPLFHIIDRLISYFNINLTGADLLFENNTIDKPFHNYSGPLVSAFMLLFTPQKHVSDILSALSDSILSKKDTLSLLASLISKECHCIAADGDTFNYHSYLLPVSGKKIIIIKTDIKKQHMSVNIKNAYKNLQKYIPDIHFFSQVNEDVLVSDNPLSKKEIKMLCFMLNEEKRIRKYPNISGFDDLCGIIKESCYELLEISESPQLSLLIDILSSITDAKAFRPLSDNSSVYCIVNNEAVDDFTLRFEKEFEKKAGYKPTFYICDTITSGIERGII